MGNVFHNHTYLEVDGKKLSEYSTFKEAIKAGLELKTISPHSSVRVREMEETTLQKRLRDLYPVFVQFWTKADIGRSGRNYKI